MTSGIALVLSFHTAGFGAAASAWLWRVRACDNRSGLTFQLDTPRIRHTLALIAVALGSAVAMFSLALLIRSYMPCPYWDEWVVVNQIGRGAGPQSWHWLWSQQNEHRIVIVRLLVWFDLFAFGGRNVSLFVETFLLQLLHLAAVCFVVECYSARPIFLKRCMQGLFAFALFHPNQLGNFVWAFQVSFVLPFLIATLAIIAVAFFRRWRRMIALVIAAVSPLIAAMNLAGGLLIGPVVIALAAVKRLRARYIAGLACALALSAAAFLYGYHRSATDLPPRAEISRGKDLFVYVLTYFGASWTKILPHKERTIAFISLCVYAVLLIPALRKWRATTDLEWFLLAECTLMLATAAVTALGRIQFGVGQAFASRYQTPAMIYWAALGSLVLIRCNERWPHKIVLAQAGLVVIMLASLATFPVVWRVAARHAAVLKAACQIVMGPSFNRTAARNLYENPAIIEQARPFLQRIWAPH